jgi:predicted DNA-binding transcriptional regulator YafY
MSLTGVTNFAEETKTDRICRAITGKKIVRFYYRGTERVVEPYICGLDNHNRVILLGYQTEERDFPVRNWGWRLFEIDQVSYLGVTRDEFNRPRLTLSPFDPLDTHLKEIYCSVARAESPVERISLDRKAA